MTADRVLLAKARRELEEDAAAHRKRRAQLRRRLYEEEPRLSALDAKIRTVFLDALVSPETMEDASSESLALQRERASLLRALGAPPEILEDEPLCPVCKDGGYADGEPCACLLERYHALQMDALSATLDVRNHTFAGFNAKLYSDAFDPEINGSPRRNIEDIRELCQIYCADFESKFENLLFSGEPGTGKTYLAACVAGAVSKHGYSVVYGAAAHHLGQAEALHFGRGDSETEFYVKRLTECDLLIIDDLGAEFVTPFTQSALLDMVNTRVMRQKKMLLCTNLTKDKMTGRYSPALVSRLEGEFLRLDFFGEDLRQKL